MEVVGALASIGAVVELSGKVFNLCQEYVKTVKNAKGDIIRLRNEVLSVQDILRNVDDRIRTQDSSSLATLQILITPDGPLQCCGEELKKVKAKLKEGKKNSRASEFINQALKWPLSAKDVEKVLRDIERYKTLFQLALANEQLKLTQVLDGRIQDLSLLVHETKAEVVGFRSEASQHAANASRDDFLRWLGAPNMLSAHENALKQHLQSTGEWFTKSVDFEEWKRTRGRWIVLYGMAGCGKTVLSSAVIEEIKALCKAARNAACAYFYFDFRDTKRQSALSFLLSIVAQLAGPNIELARRLQDIRSDQVNYGEGPSVRVLKTMVQDCASFQGLSDVYIMVDALDECPANASNPNRPEMLAVIDFLNSLKSSNIHFYTTSRCEFDISAKLSSLKNICQLEIVTEEVDVDIKRHISARLETDDELNKWPIHVKKEIEQVLGDLANGMFRWVQCHLDELRQQLTVKTLLIALHSLPETLDQTYERIITNIHKDYRDHARRALIWLSYSIRPLTMIEVAEASIFEPSENLDTSERLREPAALLRILGSLVTVTSVAASKHVPEISLQGETEIPCMQLAHFTVKEYLIHERLGASIRNDLQGFYLTPDACEVFLTRACVQYIYALGQSVEKQDKEFMQSYPLWLYAYRFFTAHLKHVSERQRDEVRECLVSLIRSPKAMATICPDASLTGRLVYAASQGMTAAVSEMLDQGADVNGLPDTDDPEETPTTALVMAVDHGEGDIVKILLDHGADPNVICVGNPVLRTAVENVTGSLEATDRLPDKTSAINIVRLLLQHGADANTKGGSDESALVIALSNHSTEVVELLLQHGADPNSLDPYGGHVSVIWAAYYDSTRSMKPIRLLLEYGANPNSLNSEGQTVLECALDREDVVACLLKHGADAGQIKNPDILSNLIAFDDMKTLKLLLDHGTDANRVDDEGNTPLGAALAHSNLRALQTVLEHGGDVNQRFLVEDGQWKAVDYAKAYSMDEYLHLLLKYGGEQA